MKSIKFLISVSLVLMFLSRPAFAVSSYCGYGLPGVSGANYRTVYHRADWDSNDWYVATTFYEVYPYVRRVGTVIPFNPGTLVHSMLLLGYPNYSVQHFRNPANGTYTYSGLSEIGYDDGSFSSNWFTPLYGDDCGGEDTINNTPVVSVNISPGSTVQVGTSITFSWSAPLASSCSYQKDGGTPMALPNTDDSITVTANMSHSGTYVVTCLGPLGELDVGPLGSPGANNRTLEVIDLCTYEWVSDTDQTAIAEVLSWGGAEPFERNAVVNCTSAGEKTAVNHRDSFGVIYPGYSSNDPCSVSINPNVSATLVGGMHSHPYFNSNTEYLAGNGCHGATQGLTSSGLSNLNNANKNFSTGSPSDADWPDETDTPLYLLVPLRNMVKRLSSGTVTVYP